MSEQTEQQRKPDLRLVYPKGNYHEAMLAYQEARLFILQYGLASTPGVAGTVYSPTYKGEKSPTGTIPPDWDLDEKEWQVTVEFWAETSGIEEILKDIPAPANAKWEEVL